MKWIPAASLLAVLALSLTGCFTTREDSLSPTPEGYGTMPSDDIPSSDIGMNEQPSGEVLSTPSSTPEEPVSEVPDTSPYGASFEEASVEEMRKSPDAKPESPAEDVAAAAKAKVHYVARWVNASSLSVRATPSTNAKVLRRLSRNAPVDVEIQGPWARLDDGGWVLTRYLTSVRPKLSTPSTRYKNLNLGRPAAKSKSLTPSRPNKSNASPSRRSSK
jgi:hypothetical protein